jgi:soluble P-type ATPase
MIEIDIPGYKKLRLKYIVLDYNGTLGCDGEIIDGVAARLESLAKKLEIHVVTADTFGIARSKLQGLPCELSILPEKNQDIAKRDYVKRLGSGSTACIGNGRNDRLMLKEAALGIAVILEEGAAVKAVEEADVICTSIISALELLSNPLRLVATLRS